MISVEFVQDSCEFGNRKRGVFRRYPVSEKRGYEGDSVFGNYEIASGEIRLGTKRRNENIETSRGNSKAKPVVGTGGVDESDEFLNHHVVHPNARGFLDARTQRIEAEGGGERSEYRFDAVRCA